jgi:addiction module RelE/StbE family toxin
MVKIIWSDLAIDDLKSIHEYISKDSTRYATEIVERIIQKVGQLENFHKSGRIVPEFKNDLIRELIIENYRIVYTVDEQIVSIARIHHSSRLNT